MTARDRALAALGTRVRAASNIAQSPLSDAPAVPAGALGAVEDADLELDPPMLVVHFGDPYGAVLCELGEVGL